MADSDSAPKGKLSPRRARNILVLITVGAIVLLLLGAEAAVRVRQYLKYGSTATLEEYYTVDPKLNLRVPVANFSRGRISVNSLGFRGPEIAVPKPPGTVRLAFIGASTTWCGEVSGNDYVWPHLVTAELAGALPGTRFDYVNGGVPGYTLGSMLKNLQYRISPLQPDIIVYYEAANNLSGEMRELAAKRGLIGEETVEVASWPSQYSLLWYLVEKNLRVEAAQRNARTNRDRLEVDPGTLGKEYREGLTELIRTAQQHAQLVAIATFSIQPRRNQTAEQQMQASTSALFYMPFATPPLIIGAYERYNQIAREVAKETGALLIEGENDIPGDAGHFTDSVHFSDAGSKAMAQRVSRALLSSPQLKEVLSKIDMRR
jgi:lysophospholipase L1-like esterase